MRSVPFVRSSRLADRQTSRDWGSSAWRLIWNRKRSQRCASVIRFRLLRLLWFFTAERKKFLPNFLGGSLGKQEKRSEQGHLPFPSVPCALLFVARLTTWF